MIKLSFLFIFLTTFLFSDTYKFNDINEKNLEFSIGQETIHLKGNEGKYLLLAFWGRYCPPCLLEIPELVSITKKYSKDISIIAIHAQNIMGVDVAREFVKTKGINYTVVDSLETYSFINDLQQVTGWGGFIPFSILLDRDGKFVKYFTSDITEDEILSIIRK